MTRLVATDSYYLLHTYYKIVKSNELRWHCFVAVEIDSWFENKFLFTCQPVNQPIR